MNTHSVVCQIFDDNSNQISATSNSKQRQYNAMMESKISGQISATLNSSREIGELSYCHCYYQLT